jgi:hypothetical protein
MKRHSANTFNTSDEAIMPTNAEAIENIQSTQEVNLARHQAIQESAYWRASERGFAFGGELDDWLDAEAHIDGVKSGSVME